MPHISEAYTIPVDAYEHPTEKIDQLLSYPGYRPAVSFMTDGETLTSLPDEYDAFETEADQYLADAGLPLMKDRIPVLAYGSNASPVRLKEKMTTFGSQAQPLMQTVPHCAVTVPNMLAVWHGVPGQTGSTFAELYNGPEAYGATMQAHVAFLTKEQLAAIHTTEGGTYSAAEVNVMVGKDKPVQIPAVAYVALNSTLLMDRNQPILVNGIRQSASKLSVMSTMTAEQAVGYMLRHSAYGDGQVSVQDFITEGIDLTLAQKKDRQAGIGKRLAAMGLSRRFAFTDTHSSRLIGRADFTSLPGDHDKHLLYLPEMALAAIRPSEQEVDQKIDQLQKKYPTESRRELRIRAMQSIDPARMVSRRAFNEIATRLELAETSTIAN